ncbi:MAG: hypothetical protein MUC36_22655 [Planctomycetes bacterium]|jgi:hypothetical protein|nr:hypothetical protein [Planctomycetota bacterium]
MRTLPLLAIPTLLAALPAQGDPFRFVPGNSALVVRMAAPAKWQQRFAQTQVAKLADGETMGPMLAQMRKGFDDAIEQLRQSGEFDADLVEQLVTKYQGDIVMSVQVDFAKLMAAIEDGAPPPVSVVVALSPDGSYDLAGLAKAVEKSAEENSDGDPIGDLTVGDLKLRVGGDDEMQVSLPTMIDGHLVMLASPQLEKSAAMLLASSDRFSADGQGGQPLFVHMQLGSAMPMLLDFMSAEMDSEGAPFDFGKVMRGFGLGSLESFTMTIDAEGKHLAGDLSVQMNGNERGLIAMVAGGTTAPKLLRLVPPGSESFSVSTFALAPLYETVGKLWGEFEEAAGMDWNEAQTAFAESMKVRLKEDLVDHLGTEMLSLADLAAQAEAMDPDEDDPMAAIGSSCIGIGLRNGKAFAASLESMLRSQGLHASRKTEDYQGNKIYRLPLGGLIEVEYCVTDELLLLAIGKGESARQSLRGVLDARANPAAEGEVPTKIKATLATMPAGWHSLQATSMSGMMAMMAGAMEGAMMQAMGGEVPAEAEMAMQMVRGLGADMKRLGIETMVATSYSTANSLRTVMRW